MDVTSALVRPLSLLVFLVGVTVKLEPEVAVKAYQALIVLQRGGASCCSANRVTGGCSVFATNFSGNIRVIRRKREICRRTKGYA